MLLDEAKEFKYIIAGLLKLPYSVELLQRLLCEVVQDVADLHSPWCNFAKGHA
ncbi:hypothetical protein MUK42_18415 [Musa troglodytarum]|uniref:Uncharacterized protein n=1 Tax=Musa troglodytarum TaxID=320322 RepID=A0A9E7G0Y6_9LILI|nr:hypothetical protein MUK42_18415 [Musa troglodytarum]